MFQWCARKVQVFKVQETPKNVDQIGALVEAANEAWTNLPMVRVLRAFEMRRDVADEMLREDGACPTEGKGRRGAHRAHTHPAYAALRTRLGIETDAR